MKQWIVFALLIVNISAGHGHDAVDEMEPGQCVSRFDYEYKMLHKMVELEADMKKFKEAQTKVITNKGCEDGWVVFQGSCYFFGSTELSFSDAESFCNNRTNSHLANIETAAENTFIRNFLRDWKASPYWFGMTDEETENVWKHIPSGVQATFFSWYGPEPNQGRAANCVTFWQNRDYLWADEPCNKTHKPICEKSLQTSLDQCVVECAIRPGCLAISFCRRFTLCNLLNTDGLSEPTITSTGKDDCDFVTKSGMRYMLPTGCQECKNWQNCDIENEKCTITECPKLSLDNGLLLGNMNGIGNRVRFKCYDGYQPETDEIYATCEETGDWSVTPKCVEEITKKECEEGWRVFQESCYFFGNEKLTFKDAEEFCNNLVNAHLANIETETENNFIRGVLRDLKASPHWFGLTDEETEKVWKHFPSGIQANFTAWYYYEPNLGRDGNCVALWQEFDYEWADEPCTNEYKPICEKRAQ